MKTDKTGAELRKNENSLIITGYGVMLFGAWSVIKGSATMFLNKDMMQQLESTVDSQYTTAFRWILIVTVMIALLADLAFRVYIGRAAGAEGRGKKQSWTYVVFAGLITLASIWSIVLYLIPGYAEYISMTDRIVGLLVEASSINITVELIISAIRVKKVVKEDNNDAA